MCVWPRQRLTRAGVTVTEGCFVMIPASPWACECAHKPWTSPPLFSDVFLHRGFEKAAPSRYWPSRLRLLHSDRPSLSCQVQFRGCWRKVGGGAGNVRMSVSLTTRGGLFWAPALGFSPGCCLSGPLASLSSRTWCCLTGRTSAPLPQDGCERCHFAYWTATNNSFCIQFFFNPNCLKWQRKELEPAKVWHFSSKKMTETTNQFSK